MTPPRRMYEVGVEHDRFNPHDENGCCHYFDCVPVEAPAPDTRACATPMSPYLQHIRLEALTTYMLRTGWRPIRPYKRGIQVFQGPPDVKGNPLEIVLPTDESSPDRKIYFTSALNLLAALQDKNPQCLAKQMTPTIDSPPDTRLARLGEALDYYEGYFGVDPAALPSVEARDALAQLAQCIQAAQAVVAAYQTVHALLCLAPHLPDWNAPHGHNSTSLMQAFRATMQTLHAVLKEMP